MDGDTGERWGEDPGWRVLRRARGDRLMTLRRVYLSFAVGLVVLADQARLLLPFRDSTAADIWALAIGAIAFATYVTAPRIERPLPCESDAMLAGAFRARLFLRIAFAETPALFGFTAAFVTDSNWVFYLCVLFSLPALVRAAPTRAALIRDQDELTARGCNLSLVAALRSTPPKPK